MTTAGQHEPTKIQTTKRRRLVARRNRVASRKVSRRSTWPTIRLVVIRKRSALDTEDNDECKRNIKRMRLPCPDKDDGDSTSGDTRCFRTADMQNLRFIRSVVLSGISEHAKIFASGKRKD
mmetsp:Transcript_123912/g.185229  ORF Transcript_123912/g.185229 Transcript_123912/m.185229 type:complete len:121 (-) Transcript_123912:244-606(-)|eukprot:CAMPEP_0117014636 /NCGR_PEP_ID=MMETSP0472-20121206/11836_1 /TAXON_ID=693140 ORGANISM="Tiarina fusus, Strain LIS" /NCGR_SAMPLE_ID=MMETSP0472 /ASSEMBLY_ACC=CAM_ASM_000603 /LENGTH=120 /DNA_ID=CAMNT_0004718243 /DNA_START=99 /DNA_END=461 /DNA_ORIENTATION=+